MEDEKNEMVEYSAMPARRSGSLAVMPAEMTIEELVARTQKVQMAMQVVMKNGEHYGVIPGTPKPTLLKPGAEKLLNLFMLDPEYSAVREQEGDHLTIISTCTLYHIGTGVRLGSGMGSCSTRESKYAYRHAGRVCPECGAEAINKSKFPPRKAPKDPPGWYCYAKVGGCGKEFSANDSVITDQVLGRVDNPDKADQYNTVLKMANKRSLIAVVLNVTAASDIFMQDIEDMLEFSKPAEPPLRDQVKRKGATVEREPPDGEPIDLIAERLSNCQALSSLTDAWGDLTAAQRKKYVGLKDKIKAKLSAPAPDEMNRLQAEAEIHPPGPTEASMLADIAAAQDVERLDYLRSVNDEKFAGEVHSHISAAIRARLSEMVHAGKRA